MKRNEYIRFVQSKKSNGKKVLSTGKSVTDPTFARTGRQLIFQPLPIEYRMKYPDGVALDKDNPHNIKEYDKIYPDTFDAIRQANADIKNTKKNLNEIKRKYEDSKKPKPQPEPQPQE